MNSAVAWAAGIFLAAIFSAMGVVIAYSADHHHPPEHAELHSRYYSTWERPDQPGVSCCSDKDCAPAEARMVGGQWQARHIGTETWFPIPDAKIERNRESPDGRNHLCELAGMVFCFVAGAGI
jgi:hypothetical protein